MVRIPPFAVEQWMDKYEVIPGVLNVAETCAASVSIQELQKLADSGSTNGPVDLSTILQYGAIRGSKTLRNTVAGLYGNNELDYKNVLITQGAISANFQILYSFVNPEDHVICVHPTYQQLYSVPAAIGADVTLWMLKASNGFVPDVKELDQMIRPNTKMIIINNPNNPTGAPIATSALDSIVTLAKQHNIIVFSDEVYRPLYHNLFDDDAEIPRSILSFGYDKTIATGSMSKAYAMAGIRIGWIATKDKAMIETLASTRDYTTISVSQIDDQIASYALSDAVRIPLLKRNVTLAKTNLALLETFINKHSTVCSWVKPKAGTTAFVQFKTDNNKPVDDVQFCKDLLEKTKVMLVPGSRCFGDGNDFFGYVRFGYVCHTEVLVEALAKLEEYLESKHVRLNGSA